MKVLSNLQQLSTDIYPFIITHLENNVLLTLYLPMFIEVLKSSFASFCGRASFTKI